MSKPEVFARNNLVNWHPDRGSTYAEQYGKGPFRVRTEKQTTEDQHHPQVLTLRHADTGEVVINPVTGEPARFSGYWLTRLT